MTYNTGLCRCLSRGVAQRLGTSTPIEDGMKRFHQETLPHGANTAVHQVTISTCCHDEDGNSPAMHSPNPGLERKFAGRSLKSRLPHVPDFEFLLPGASDHDALSVRTHGARDDRTVCNSRRQSNSPQRQVGMHGNSVLISCGRSLAWNTVDQGRWFRRNVSRAVCRENLLRERRPVDRSCWRVELDAWVLRFRLEGQSFGDRVR